MRQLKSFIQIIIILIIIKWKKNQMGQGASSGGEGGREGEKYFIFFSLLLSYIYENRTVGFHRG